MKKLISIVAALSMIASLSVTSFAAIDASVSDAAAGTTLSYSEGTFTASITGNASQDTIVVVKGDGSTISTTSIEYINQDAASQNFNFVLKNTPDSVDDFKADPADENETVASGATLTYTVLMGGDTVSKTEVGTITYTYTKDVVYYTVIFKDAAGNTLSSTEYEENTAVVIPADQTKAEDETYTYTFEGWKVEGAEDSTAVKEGITATGNLTYVPVFSATQKEVGGGDAENVTISYQLVKVDVSSTTVDATVSTADVAKDAVIYTSVTEPTLSKYAFVGWYTDEALTTKLDKALTATEATTIYAKMAKIYKRGDANEDSKGNITAADATAIMQWIADGKPATSPIGVKMPGTSIKYGEANGDSKGNVTAADATAIMQWIADGKPSTSIIGVEVEVTKD